jgi:predicted Kef-type K+ transport protein
MEFTLLFIAFIFGFACKIIKMPPLIGFLIAGFVLNAMGFSLSESLTTIADLGITVMLFVIGLKLNIKDLGKTEIWFTSLAHALVWVLIVCLFVLVLINLSLPFVSSLTVQQAALVGFAFSFSSTVCVVKTLEESGESKTRHGKVAIGILIVQDILAVLFLVAATGELPSLYALGLFLLIPATPILRKFLEEAGHGELLPLSGLVFALGGYFLFELVGVKGDLGALVIGILLAPSSKASELSKSLLTFKDLFLIGFFLTIGLTALPTLEMVLIALLFSLLLPVKYLLFFSLFAGSRLRARTSYLTSLVMSNYSEFGLIVIAVAASTGMLSKDWLVIMALSVSFSFVISSILYKRSHQHYLKVKNSLKRFQSAKVLPEDQYPCLSDAEVLVIGMGRVGKGAFNALNKRLGNTVWGMDADIDRVNSLKTIGQNTIVGDGDNIDLWESLDLSNIKLVLLAVPSIDDSSSITAQLRQADYSGQIAAIARYEDEVEPLLEEGVDRVFNFFNDAGLGFAEESITLLDEMKKPATLRVKVS